jgi:hypothetical protein
MEMGSAHLHFTTNKFYKKIYIKNAWIPQIKPTIDNKQNC